MVKLQSLFRLTGVALVLVAASAEWKVDERCMNLTHRALALQERSDENANFNRQGGDGAFHRRLQQQVAFQMKMFWREGYCWQEEWIERHWCMSCEGGTCNVGDHLWIQECMDDDIQLFTYEPVVGTGGGRLRPFTHQGLCLEHTNSTKKEMILQLRPCSNSVSQILTGIQGEGHFEIYPFGATLTHCITQGHHPKPKELIVAQPCANPRWDHTNYYMISEPRMATPPTTIPLAPWEICHPGRLLYKNNITATGEPFYNEAYDISLEQWTNGNLVVTHAGTVVWESGVNATLGDYFTKLQGDGNLVTYRGKAPKGESIVWRSGKNGPSTIDYFLGLSCEDNYTVSIYEYFPSDPGRIIWSSGGSVYLPPPTPSPPNLWVTYDTAEVRSVPFNMSALEYTDFYDADDWHRGYCGLGPVDSSPTDDFLCGERSSPCAVTHTVEGEWLEYSFETESPLTLDVILRLASPSYSKRVRVEIDSVSGFGTATTPGTDWMNFEDVVAWNEVVLPSGRHRMKVTFEDGHTNLCSISVTLSQYQGETYAMNEEEQWQAVTPGPSSTPTTEASWWFSSQPSTEPTPDHTIWPSVAATEVPMSASQIEMFTVPFDIPALSYSNFAERSGSDGGHGNCRTGGPVDAKYVDDSVCLDRGSPCSVGWTQPGDMLEYIFELSSDATVDLILRVADQQSRQLTVVFPGLEGYATVSGPGLGWNDFVDVIAWESLSLSAGKHTMRIFFVNGNMNVCSISFRYSSTANGRLLRKMKLH